MLVKCICTNCAGHLEFEEENSGEKIKCPHCGFETTLFLPGTGPDELENKSRLNLQALRRRWLKPVGGVVLLAALGYGLFLCGSYITSNYLPQSDSRLTSILVLVLVCLLIPFALFWMVFPVVLTWQLHRLTKVLTRMPEPPTVNVTQTETPELESSSDQELVER